jgi:hypothetical protein
MISPDSHEQPRFIGGLPETGVWTAVGLSRAQFFAILTISVGLFLVVGGPIWLHVRDPHFTRIVVSYAVIPIAVTLALAQRGVPRLWQVLAASGVLALVKLVVTAGLLIVLALARG